ncbi:MAG: ribosome-associated translation inhibitor RaiA [Novibacillus thermophilus]|mgnify:CR=1 FL=1|jgi:putative sigma-54 modulation protein|uniref:Ribosome hibernation promoting factor n=1 Tax=Novibacillus thermophilus TaxID=1471761 RepID=A0A1U9KAJ0_9BACL|nr:ribosome-associated translation inhibitor RaiA [Novibacillus thermophilus]AQS57085.1 ribosomal subunit interface protein [Novibacillus thermophilus]
MQYNIRGHNIEVTAALRDYVEKKLSRVEKYFNTAPTAPANVSLSVLKDEHTVEVTIPFPGVLLRAEETSGDMYASIDLVVEKLERQIRKYKTRVNRKARQNGSLRTLFKENGLNGSPPSAVDAEETDESEFEIVRTKRFTLKPMDVEEAILQMDMLGHNFFVFSNSSTNEVNVVYKRKDGRYGLIEPEM